jgi:hypothetical protein
MAGAKEAAMTDRVPALDPMVAGGSVLPAFPDGIVGDLAVVELFVERLETTAGAFRERMERLGNAG